MIHDPLCPYRPETLGMGGTAEAVLNYQPAVSCQCDLIAKVEDRCTPNHFRERIERLITKANRWRDENVELRKQLKEVRL